jgi:membrane peptidoglycan carboxypeptidase
MANPHWGPVEKKPKAARKWTGRVLKTIGAVVILGLVAVAAVVFVGYTTTELPNPNKDFTTATTNVYYRDGKSELGTFAVQNREPLDFKEMPESIKKAMVDAENRTFWTD